MYLMYTTHMTLKIGAKILQGFFIYACRIIAFYYSKMDIILVYYGWEFFELSVLIDEML